jgi:hypothetical protein
LIVATFSVRSSAIFFIFGKPLFVFHNYIIIESQVTHPRDGERPLVKSRASLARARQPLFGCGEDHRCIDGVRRRQVFRRMCPVRIVLAFLAPDRSKPRSEVVSREKAASAPAAFCSLEPIGSGVAPRDGPPSVSFERPFAPALSSLKTLPSKISPSKILPSSLDISSSLSPK